MAPWDSLRYFRIPKPTVFTLTGAAVKIASADPTRVLLSMSVANKGGDLWVAPTNLVGSAFGYHLTDSGIPFEVTHQVHGALVQMEWWAFGAAVNGVFVQEMVLQDWPIPDEIGTSPFGDATGAQVASTGGGTSIPIAE